ncbi:hypothetical protein AAEX28_14810 [Lentisphaerota bacterium WC36G]|nr:hypothetical protein LJT99_01565 [Lentisphaerae bacterium WC36]
MTKRQYKRKILKAIYDSILLQGILLILFGMILCDGPPQVCAVAAISYWIMIIVILLKRRYRINTFDYNYLRFGFIFNLGIVGIYMIVCVVINSLI